LKIPKLNTGEVVYIEWLDIKSALGWAYNPTYKRIPARLHSIGYVVQRNNECLTITTSMDYRGASLDDLSIPISCIKELEILEGYGLRGIHVQ
jgi:hypothetical protein